MRPGLSRGDHLTVHPTSLFVVAALTLLPVVVVSGEKCPLLTVPVVERGTTSTSLAVLCSKRLVKNFSTDLAVQVAGQLEPQQVCSLGEAMVDLASSVVGGGCPSPSLLVVWLTISSKVVVRPVVVVVHVVLWVVVCAWFVVGGGFLASISGGFCVSDL